jgi:hypothetical protein
MQSFIFWEGLSTLENGDVLSQFGKECCVPGSFFPKDCFDLGTFRYKISGTKNA